MSMLLFVLMRLAPGNITDIIFESAGYVDEADRKRWRPSSASTGPLIVQYGRWLGDFVRGELGKSYRYDLPAWQVIKPRLPVTLELAVLAHGLLRAARRAVRRDQRRAAGPAARLRAARRVAGRALACPRSGWP